MPALVAGIHVFGASSKSWMAGTSPAMTRWMGRRDAYARFAATGTGTPAIFRLTENSVLRVVK